MKIALIGLGPSKQEPEGWTKWGLAWDGHAARYDLLFEMHDWHRNGPPSLRKKIREIDVPTLLQEKQLEAPYSLAYPLDDVIAIGGDYFACSLAYMIGRAILEKPRVIGLFGFDMTDGHEHQRPNAEYWLGIARGRGIEIVLPPGSPLLRFSPRYGYAE